MYACGFWPLCPFHILISPLSRSLDRWRRIFGIVWPFETVVSSIFFPCLDMFSDYFAPQMWHQTRKYDHVKSSLRSNEPLWQYSHNVNGNQTQTKKKCGNGSSCHVYNLILLDIRIASPCRKKLHENENKRICFWNCASNCNAMHFAEIIFFHLVARWH